jgi:hypothetical protein
MMLVASTLSLCVVGSVQARGGNGGNGGDHQNGTGTTRPPLQTKVNSSSHSGSFRAPNAKIVTITTGNLDNNSSRSWDKGSDPGNQFPGYTHVEYTISKVGGEITITITSTTSDKGVVENYEPPYTTRVNVRNTSTPRGY